MIEFLKSQDLAQLVMVLFVSAIAVPPFVDAIKKIIHWRKVE